jgi:hypothetical protein
MTPRSVRAARPADVDALLPKSQRHRWLVVSYEVDGYEELVRS